MIAKSNNPPELLHALDCLKRLSILLETDLKDDIPQIALISQLQIKLLSAVEDYEQFCQNEITAEDALRKQADLLWFCNQCEYYLTDSSVANLSRRHNRARRQIQMAVFSSIRFKLYTHIRRLLLGKSSTALPWRDLLLVFKPWRLR
ncbi:hypothetical protein [Acaryochloris sp. IP29b_bin.148]|uniref:hypothetical protein n=1 Tax=Acaryochloris sp. IP29b_bin.148 TaxID=2969218 RepID=UPI002625FE9D|nr:hypothetical protein [Acaryochloris sp. IP29b_bin.148]